MLLMIVAVRASRGLREARRGRAERLPGGGGVMGLPSDNNNHNNNTISDYNHMNNTINNSGGGVTHARVLLSFQQPTFQELITHQ